MLNSNVDRFKVASLFRQLRHWGINFWRTPELVVLVVIIVHLIVTTYLALSLNIWVDEAYSLKTSGQDFWYAVTQAVKFEEQPPLYFALLSLWRIIHRSVFFARLFSMLCIATAIYFATLICKKLFKSLHPAWLTILIAFNPFVIWAAVEIRVYASIILLSTLLVLTFMEGYLASEPRKYTRWLYVFLAIASLYNQYYLGFILVAHGLTLFLLKPDKVKQYIIDMAVVTVFFSPMLWFIPAQIANKKNVIESTLKSWSFFNDFILYIYRGFLGYIFPMSWMSFLATRVIQASTFLCLMFIAIKNMTSVTKSHLLIGIIIAVQFFFFANVNFFIGGNAASEIHRASIFIPAQIFTLSIFTLLDTAIRKHILKVWTIVIFLSCLLSLHHNYTPLLKIGDYQRLAAYITSREKPNQPILLYNHELELPFQHYYTGANQLLPLPAPQNFDHFDVTKFVLTSEAQIADALSRNGNQPDCVWLVLDTRSYLVYLFPKSYQLIEQFIQKDYTTELNQEFYGSTVKLLQRKSAISGSSCQR